MERAEHNIKNPILSIWFKPRETILHQLYQKKGLNVNWLFILAGVVLVFDRAATANWGDEFGTLAVIVGILFFGAIIGLILFYIVTATFFFIGKILNGQSSFDSLRMAVGWSLLPVVTMLLLWFVKIGIFGKEIFILNSNDLEASYAYSFILMFTRVIEVMVGIYTLGIIVISIAFVQEFSIRRAVFNVLFSLLILSFLALIFSNLVQFLSSP